MPTSSDKKIVLITGGSGGIGSQLSEKFASRDYHVVINYLHSKTTAEKIRDSLDKKFGSNTAFTLSADVSRREEVNNMFDEIEKNFGSPDVLINCAGINRDKPFLEMNNDEWTSVISTILTGTFYCSQEFALRYKGNNGNIVNIGALTAIRGRKNGANYCSARAGVINLTKCMALELAPRIRVNCITPGWINTTEVMNRYRLYDEQYYNETMKTIPMARLGTPEDVAELLDFVINKTSYVTGQNYLIDGGMLMH